MNKTWVSNSENDTVTIANEIADMLAYPSIICLYGDLGAGKTAFSRAFIRHITKNADETVPSPTYTLVQTYDDDTIWHFDLYRLDTSEQLYDIGWEDAIISKLCLIEWPERLRELKPQNTVDISIEFLPDGTRSINLSS